MTGALVEYAYSFKRGQGSSGGDAYGVKTVTIDRGIYIVLTHNVGVNDAVRLDLAVATASSINLYNITQKGNNTINITVSGTTLSSTGWISTYALCKYY